MKTVKIQIVYERLFGQDRRLNLRVTLNEIAIDWVINRLSWVINNQGWLNVQSAHCKDLYLSNAYVIKQIEN